VDVLAGGGEVGAGGGAVRSSGGFEWDDFAGQG
jgi:hypothetical protein